MSKSIYEEAIEMLLNMGTEFISIPCNPIGEENSDMIHLRDATETYETNMHEVVKALEQALNELERLKKQEKLLELYKELAYYTRPIIIDDKYVELQQKIKELEDEQTNND